MMKTYARIFEGTVVELFSTDGDITEMFHPDLIWVECGDGVSEGWGYDGTVFTAPAPRVTSLEENIATRDAGLLYAATRMAPLQDAIDLGEATAAEEQVLLTWKRYRVALNRIVMTAGDLEWPTYPEA